MASLKLSAVRKQFGDTLALEHLDLSVEDGEFIALLGPSGCGKTTALRIVAGFEEPDSGTVTVAGRQVGSIPPNKREMGMVFQAYSLFPHLSALGNVMFGLRRRGMGSKEATSIAVEMLELVGLGERASSFPHQMSGGQQQRVALARALAIRPQVLLLDEPLSALDAKVRVQLRGEIRRIQKDLGITTLFVTHDQEEALAIADRVGVMSHGRLEQLAPPADVYERPATTFVARFVGKMNELTATVAGPDTLTIEGTPFAGIATGARREGEKVGVLVRPEHLSLTPTANGGLPGRVVAITFNGPRSEVAVAVGAAGTVLTVDVPTTEAKTCLPDDTVGVEVDTARVLVD